MVKDIKLHLNNGQHYSPGSVVEGSLEVSVDKPKDYDRVIVELWGGANVRWTESDGNGSSITYQYSEPYFNPKIEVWKAEATPTGRLPIGVHTFPFSFHLPQDIPSSFHTVIGQIKYEIEAKIMRNGLFQKNHAIKALLKVENRTPRTDILRLYSEPVTAIRTQQFSCLFWKRGSVTATVNLPRTGFSPGEVIPISVDICNESSKQIRVASVLKRRCTFTVHPGTGRRRTRVFNDVIVRTLSSPIMPGATVTFVDNNMIVPIDADTTVRDCSCISVEYTLEVIIKIPWSLDKIVKTPLAIAYGAPVTEPQTFGLRPQHPAGGYVPPQPQYNPVAALTTTAPPSYNQAIGF